MPLRSAFPSVAMAESTRPIDASSHLTSALAVAFTRSTAASTRLTSALVGVASSRSTFALVVFSSHSMAPLHEDRFPATLSIVMAPPFRGRKKREGAAQDRPLPCTNYTGGGTGLPDPCYFFCLSAPKAPIRSPLLNTAVEVAGDPGRHEGGITTHSLLHGRYYVTVARKVGRSTLRRPWWHRSVMPPVKSPPVILAKSAFINSTRHASLIRLPLSMKLLMSPLMLNRLFGATSFPPKFAVSSASAVNRPAAVTAPPPPAENTRLVYRPAAPPL